MKLLQKALDVAFTAHEHQIRRISKAPYMVHVLEVVKLLLYEGVSEDILVAGALHDTLEDTSYSAESLRQDFGEAVYAMVVFLTEPFNTPDSSREHLHKSWKLRKTHTIENLPRGSRDEQLISLADKLATLISLREDLLVYGETVWSSFSVSKDELLWYYSSLGSIYANSLSDTRLYTLFVKELHELFE